MLNDRENILSALREKPLKVYEIMKRANVVNEEACQFLLLKMRDEGLVKFTKGDGSSDDPLKWVFGATTLSRQIKKKAVQFKCGRLLANYRDLCLHMRFYRCRTRSAIQCLCDFLSAGFLLCYTRFGEQPLLIFIDIL